MGLGTHPGQGPLLPRAPPPPARHREGAVAGAQLLSGERLYLLQAQLRDRVLRLDVLSLGGRVPRVVPTVGQQGQERRGSGAHRCAPHPCPQRPCEGAGPGSPPHWPVAGPSPTSVGAQFLAGPPAPSVLTHRPGRGWAAPAQPAAALVQGERGHGRPHLRGLAPAHGRQWESPPVCHSALTCCGPPAPFGPHTPPGCPDTARTEAGEGAPRESE